MMFLLLLIIPDCDNLEDLLVSLHAVGAVNINTVNSEEFLPNNDDQPLEEDFPIIPSLQSITDLSQNSAKTIFAFAPTKSVLKDLVSVTNSFLEKSEITHESLLSVFPVGNIASILN